MKYLYLFLIGMFVIQSCSYQAEEEKQTATPTIPVVNFDELEPLLHLDNDTTYIINFWATWCKPCVTELPDFEKAAAFYKDQKVKLILVSLDFPKQVESHVMPFIAEYNVKSEVILLFDTKANVWIDKVSPEWTGSIPATLIYNKNFRKFHEGSYSYEELKSIVELNKL